MGLRAPEPVLEDGCAWEAGAGAELLVVKR